jgi:hypothetical protein
MQDSGYVYVLEFKNFVKVGMSKNPKTRIRDIELAVSEEATNVFTIFLECPSRIERDVCDHLYSKRIEVAKHPNETFLIGFDDCVSLVDYYKDNQRVYAASFFELIGMIKNDGKGMYSLDDFHKASGSENRHKPSYFLKLDRTIDMISVMGSTVKKMPGRYGGTYSSMGILRAYAMWISPKYTLEIINDFASAQDRRIAEIRENKSNLGKLICLADKMGMDDLVKRVTNMASKYNAKLELK